MTQGQEPSSHRWQPDMWQFEALYAEPPRLDAEALRAALAARLGEVELVSDGADGADGAPLLLALPGHAVDYSDRQGVPSQIAIIPSDTALDPADYVDALQQTWDWDGKATALAQCRHAVLVTEFMGRGLDMQARRRIIQAIMHVIIDNGGVVAISQSNACCLLEPATYVANHANGLDYYGLLNVRFFNISNHEGDMLMDTLGLSVFGVPDLQCHFRELPPGEVARFLFNAGVYLIDNGDVIEDGHTLAGITEGSRWHCQHEDALVAPERTVLDANPGAPHAAGNRSA